MATGAVVVVVVATGAVVAPAGRIALSLDGETGVACDEAASVALLAGTADSLAGVVVSLA